MPLPAPISITTSSSSSTSTSQSRTQSQLSSSSALPHTSPSELTATTATSSTGGIPFTASTARRGNPTPTFSEDRENYHRVEFEAPLSADVESSDHHQQHQQRLAHSQLNRFSIDLSLELERELENMESPPVSPGYTDTDAKNNNAGALNSQMEEISLEDGKSGKADSSSHLERGGTVVPKRGDSLHARLASEPKPDPEILAHIITQLRQALADMTKERDDLVKMLAETNQRDAETQDALQVMTEKATSAEEEMMEMRRKMKEDEDQIVLLRTKVEESRRGLMRLQTENRRQSMAPIDVARASGALAAFASPPSAKRASFVPLTGSGQGRPNGHGHKRGTSVNDSSFGAFPTPDLTPSPNAHAFNIAATETILSGGGNSSGGSRRFSGLFGRQSPPHGHGGNGNDGSNSAGVLHSASSVDTAAAAAAAAIVTANAAEIESLRKELQTIKDELETAKHDLSEVNEAKEASETCVKALREFIAENNVGASVAGATGGGGIKLPPPPMMATGQEEPLDSKKTGSGWGFKLWGNGGSTATPAVDSPMKPSIVTSGPYSAGVAIGGGQGQSPVLAPSNMMQPPASAVPIGAAPLSRKLGGFFSSRSTSVSSSHSREQSVPQQSLLNQNFNRTPTLPQLQTNAAAMMKRAMTSSSQRDSMYSYSDASSVAEPVSPGSDINGLGSAGYQQQYQFKTGGVPIERVGVVAEEDMETKSMDGTTAAHVVSMSMSSVDLDGDGLR